MGVVLWALAVFFQSFLAKYHLSIPMSPLGEAVTHNINKTMILTRHNKFGVRFKIIMVKNMKNRDLWDVCPCSLAEICVLEEPAAHSSTLKMETAGSYKMFMNFYQATQQQITEGSIFHPEWC